MNFKNLSENLIIVIVVGLLSSFITYKATIKSALETNQQSITGLRPALIEAIKKETTAIRNDIELKIDKVKKSDSLNININQRPDSKISQKITKGNCLKEGEVIIKIENLTRRQKRRLGLK